MIILTPHKGNATDNTDQVMVDMKYDGEALSVRFEVKASDLNLNEEFSRASWVNMGLWEFDVVEVFLQRKNPENHYLELEISPLGQKLAILIKKPREDFATVELVNTEASAEITPEGFVATFIIKDSDIPGASGEIIGNAHACLGKRQRNHFSLFDGNEDKPDFHRPELFQRIEDI